MQTENLDDMVGTTISVKFLEVEEDRERMVFSARRASNDKEFRAYNVSFTCTEDAGSLLIAFSSAWHCCLQLVRLKCKDGCWHSAVLLCSLLGLLAILQSFCGPPLAH